MDPEVALADHRAVFSGQPLAENLADLRGEAKDAARTKPPDKDPPFGNQNLLGLLVLDTSCTMQHNIP